MKKGCEDAKRETIQYNILVVINTSIQSLNILKDVYSSPKNKDFDVCRRSYFKYT